jgi:hypothetical protein
MVVLGVVSPDAKLSSGLNGIDIGTEKNELPAARGLLLNQPQQSYRIQQEE